MVETMKNVFKVKSFPFVALLLLTGCTTMVQVTSDPPGASVYNACGISECGTADRGHRPYDGVKGTYRGRTPTSYTIPFGGYDNVRVVWPDGEGSGWKQQPSYFGQVSAFQFIKRNTVASRTGTITGRAPSTASTITATSEKLSVLKALQEGGDISEEEYRQRRGAILDTISPLTPPPVDSHRLSKSENVRVPSEDRERVVVANAIAAPKARFDISAHIEDDPAKGDAIMGNGDGLVQKGEAFDLVVVVNNESTSTAKSVTCTIILPEDKSVKAYSELQHVVSELAPAAAMTNRFNLAMPASATTATELAYTIEVKEMGSSVVDSLVGILPTEFSVLPGDEAQTFPELAAKPSDKGGETHEDISNMATPISGEGESAFVPETEVAPLGIVTVIGRVMNPGQVSIYDARDLTLATVLEKAGGFAASASPSRIRISRRLADGTLQTRKVDLRSIITNGNVTGDIPLELGDIVMVPEVMF